VASVGIIWPDPGLEASLGCTIYWKWKEGATKTELKADNLAVQAKAPAGANSSITSGFTARVPNAKTPPYYHGADGIVAKEAE